MTIMCETTYRPNACHLTLRYEPQLTSLIIDFLKGLPPHAIWKKMFYIAFVEV